MGFLGNIGKALFGKSDKLKKFEQFSPEQQKLFQNFIGMLTQQGGGIGGAFNVLNQYLDPESEAYKNMEAPYMQQFNEQIIPQLAERFAGAGGGMGGALSSSGFGQALGAAGSQLQTNLAAMKTGLQRQAAGDIFGLAQGALGQQPFGYRNVQGYAGLLPQIAGQGAQGFAQGYGMGLGRGY